MPRRRDRLRLQPGPRRRMAAEARTAEAVDPYLMAAVAAETTVVVADQDDKFLADKKGDLSPFFARFFAPRKFKTCDASRCVRL